MNETDINKYSRHAKMFDLLRQGARAPEAPTRLAATAARYLDDDAAGAFIASSIASLRAPAAIVPASKRAAPRAAAFVSRQTD